MFGVQNPRLRIIWISVISFIFGALSVVLFSKVTVAIVSNAISGSPFVTMNQINLSLKSDDIEHGMSGSDTGGKHPTCCWNTTYVNRLAQELSTITVDCDLVF